MIILPNLNVVYIILNIIIMSEALTEYQLELVVNALALSSGRTTDRNVRWGQKATLQGNRLMSALPLEADVQRRR
jgi:hypothetical protein